MLQPDQKAGLAITDHYPLKVERVTDGFSDRQIYDLTLSAKDVLNAVITLEQMAGEKPDSNAKSDAPELYRLEQKLDFVTELLTKVIQAQAGVPVKSAISLSASQLEWTTDTQYSEGELCTVSIHLSARYPLPLTVPLRLKLSQNQGCCMGEILLNDPEFFDDLTRLIFLIHRRQIARNRMLKSTNANA